LKVNNNKGWAELEKIFDRLGFRQLPTQERKLILTALLLVGVGIGFMVWGGMVKSQLPTTPPEQLTKGLTLVEAEHEYWSEGRLEREVASVLAQIKGAGRVVVDLHLAATEETKWLYREDRQERVTPSGDGGETRDISIRLEPILKRSGSEEAPVSSGKTAPVISGVLVVAEGADDPTVQRQLGEATAVLLGIGLHRVIVLPWG
jgi:stage III sporulation protein AG